MHNISGTTYLGNGVHKDRPRNSRSCRFCEMFSSKTELGLASQADPDCAVSASLVKQTLNQYLVSCGSYSVSLFLSEISLSFCVLNSRFRFCNDWLCYRLFFPTFSLLLLLVSDSSSE